ncbi:unnamed protein product [Linum trigynum]|uniref:Uncharacterized protein n=1 Tax=Linum trigynum TaxID=586398 RepID=A0AAV2D1V7_9ROSI
MEAFMAKQETYYLVRFVRGVSLAYDVVKTQLLMMKPLPTVIAAYGDLLQHEHKFKYDEGRSTQLVALASYGRQGSQGNDNTVGRQAPNKEVQKEVKQGCFADIARK